MSPFWLRNIVRAQPNPLSEAMIQHGELVKLKYYSMLINHPFYKEIFHSQQNYCGKKKTFFGENWKTWA